MSSDPDKFIRLGAWLIRRESIDALGDQDGESLVILRSGDRITLERGEAAELSRELEGDWREGSVLICVAKPD